MGDPGHSDLSSALLSGSMLVSSAPSPFFSPPIFPLLPSFPRFLPSCSRLSHHVGPGEDDSVLPLSSTTKSWFLLLFSL